MTRALRTVLLALLLVGRRTLLAGVVAVPAFVGCAVLLAFLTRQRNRLVRRLEHGRRLAALGEMSAVLAHEIRNPLASLKGNAQLLAAMLPEAAGDKPRQKAARVVDEAVRLEALTNDLLEFVRTGELRRADVDPAALLRDCAASVSDAIELDTAAAPPSWPLDDARLRQVLVNLLSNAVKYNRSGGEVRVGWQTGEEI